MAEYNIWANKKTNAWLREINEEQWNRELNGSFPSISKTAIHIAAAEKIWLDRLEGFKTKFLSDIFIGPKDELLEIWAKTSASYVDFINAMSEESLLDDFYFTNLKGEASISKKYKALAHVFNHSTFHRGQIVNYLRQVGYTAVSSTDMINYFRSR